MTRVKICGVTSVDQALACVELGADSIGLNFIASSPRRVDENTARRIVAAVGARALVVAVVADLNIAAMRDLRESTGVGCLQLHGDETAETVRSVLPHAYKAVRIANSDDVRAAEAMPGEYVLVDAKIDGVLGGTGRMVDPSLVMGLAYRRRLVLAGGLSADNVGPAIAKVRPWCVDVASGVESAPGVKDLAKVAAFIASVRRAL